MFCKNCGTQIIEGESICRNCGVSQINENISNNEKSTSDDTKIYKILSYIGILWLVGLLGNKKDDPSVKFHVGQGIILTIVSVIFAVVIVLINNLVIANVFKEKIWGIAIGVSPTGLALMGFLNFALFAIEVIFMVIGIVNVVKGKDKELPIIGSHAFYK